MTVTLHSPGNDDLTKADIDAWRNVPVAVAVDLVPDEQLDIEIRSLNPPGRQPRLFGRAVTVRCEPPDFGAVLHALELVGPGQVLVIAAGGRDDAAMTGEILGGYLHDKGCAGVVCDGAVRDVATLASWPDFSVFSRSVNPRGPTGAARGEVQLPVTIGNRQVSPGDLIIGDDDGLVALSPASVRGHAAGASARLTHEAEWVEGLGSGRPVAEVFGLSPARATQAD